MKLTKGPVALVVLALAAELAYIAVKGSREAAVAGAKKEEPDAFVQTGIKKKGGAPK